VLREYVEAMRALWTQEEASYAGEFVSFGASWAWPKPVQPHLPILVGAGGGPKTFAWIAAHADGWITTPREGDVTAKAASLLEAWHAAGRPGRPQVAALAMTRLSPEDLAQWEEAGVTEVIWGLPDRSADEVEAYLERLAERLILRG
jgi:alkanesulfonate monooxygenase SsuD/methylene tetrahydromethanopterin reductase-like flavin-dependent oxidoreductase (luciferase family)